MALDFVSEVDKRFFADNLLVTEDWDTSLEKLEDISNLLDVEANFSTDELMKYIPSDLDIPMLEDEPLENLKTRLGDPWKDVSDSSDSGMECYPVKEEPLSPNPSVCSDSSGDVPAGTALQGLDQVPYFMDSDIKLESPPMTPPRDGLEFVNRPLTNAGVINAVPLAKVPSNIVTTNVSTVANTLPKQTLINVNANNSAKPGVSQVLETKVKIQPKPVPSVPPLPAKTALTPAAGKPLVLTAEEFAKLTAQGVLKFHPPAPEAAKVLLNTKPAAAQVKPVNSVSVVPLSPTAQESTDVKALKRQQRMIKNRESACLSRKRKKEYVTTLEDKLKEYSCENERLKQENSTLRKKVDHLQNENERMRKGLPLTSAKKATCVLGVLFLLSLNLGPLSQIFINPNSPSVEVVPRNSIHHGRTLLSYQESLNKDNSDIPVFTQHKYTELKSTMDQLRRRTQSHRAMRHDLMLIKQLEEINIPLSMCPSFNNITESQRLAKELTGWVMGHKQELKKVAEQQRAEELKLRYKKRKPVKQYRPPRVIKAAMKGKPSGFPYQPKFNKPKPYQVQVFTGYDKTYWEFFNAIHRRNDTFYVVSFNHDHLLLPALAHNKTMRPRMSLVMPAVSLNETMQPPQGSIAMMQIDCEVMATKLVHIKKSAVPQKAPAQNRTNTENQPTREKNRWTVTHKEKNLHH